MIRLDHVTKEYTGRTALKDVTVEIEDGSFVFLIGPSGAGKTTLLRLLIRDTVPTSGSILVDTWQVDTLKKKHIHKLRRSVGMIFQDFKILHDRTVFENVAIGLEILGKKASEIERGVRDVLSIVGLEDKYQYFPRQLSAGELQRTSIARAIVGGPKVVLADEPTGNLDPVTAERVMRILYDIHAMGTTVLVATHNAEIVNKAKKRTILLHKGRIVSDEERGKYAIPVVIKKKS